MFDRVSPLLLCRKIKVILKAYSLTGRHAVFALDQTFTFSTLSGLVFYNKNTMTLYGLMGFAVTVCIMFE